MFHKINKQLNFKNKLIEMNFFLGLTILTPFFQFGSCFIIEGKNSEFSIRGGNENFYEKVPYHVMLKCQNDYFCGGALISTEHVLTAAHCISEQFPICTNITVTAGTNFQNEGGVTSLAQKFFIHPNYTETMQHDIAVIKLSSPFEISETISPIELPSVLPNHGDVVQVTGFGYNEFNKMSSVMKVLKFHLVDYSHCAPMYDLGASSVVLGEDDICDDLPEGQGVCFGDSGSPLTNSEMNLVVGIVSRGVSCADGFPHIYTNVFHHLSFIRENMK